ncbi:MAG TPA: hypothetical protein VFH67_02140 [bacterium]|nr:hypothetical protein [bacterium]
MYRNDVRFRLTGPKAINVVSIYLTLLGVLAMLTLPPDVGQLDELRQEGLLRAMLIVQMVLVAYFTSATACGEIVIDGEKSAWDLAASPFPSPVIARGKVATSVAFASMLIFIGLPIVTTVGALRGESLWPVALAPLVGLPFAAGAGSLGTLYSVWFDSDFTRGFVHWLTLAALVIASAALPAPWNLISPARSLQLIDRGIGPAMVLVVLGYLLIAAIAAMLVRSRLDVIRRDALAS